MLSSQQHCKMCMTLIRRMAELSRTYLPRSRSQSSTQVQRLSVGILPRSNVRTSGKMYYSTHHFTSSDLTVDGGDRTPLPTSGSLIDVGKKHHIPQEPEELIHNIGESETPAELMAILEAQTWDMDHRHSGLALRKLHDFGRSMSPEDSEIYKKNLKLTPQFQILMMSLAKLSRTYPAHQALNIVERLNYFHVSNDSLVMQIFLQLMKHHLPRLDLRESVTLGWIVKRMPKSDQTYILGEALKVQIELLHDEIPSLHTGTLVAMFEAFASDLSEETRNRLYAALLTNKADIWRVWSIVLLRSMAQLEYAEKELVMHCIQTIMKTVDRLHSTEVVSFLDSCFHLQIYDRELFLALGDRAVSGKWEPQIVAKLLVLFDRLNFLPKDLLKSFSQTESTDIRNVLAMDVWDLGKLIQMLASTRPVLTQAMRDNIVQPSLDRLAADLDNYPEDQTLSLCLSLASADIYPEVIINKLFSEEAKDRLISGLGAGDSGASHDMLSEGNKCTLIEEFLLLNQVLTQRGPDFLKDRCVSGDELKKMVGVMTGQVRLRTAETYGQHMLPRYLQLGLGGEEYFASAIVTQEGLCIDHLVCLDAEYQLRPFNMMQDSQGVDLDSLEPTQGVQSRVAALLLDEDCFYRNTGALRSAARLHVTMLQNLGYKVAVIALSKLEGIPERELPVYLKEQFLRADDNLEACHQ